MDMTEELKRRLAEVTAERIKLTVRERRREQCSSTTYFLTLVASVAMIWAGERELAAGVFIGAVGCASGSMFAALWRLNELTRESRRLEIEGIEREGGLR